MTAAIVALTILGAIHAATLHHILHRTDRHLHDLTTEIRRLSRMRDGDPFPARAVTDTEQDQ